jgi:hypothetical protein
VPKKRNRRELDKCCQIHIKQIAALIKRENNSIKSTTATTKTAPIPTRSVPHRYILTLQGSEQLFTQLSTPIHQILKGFASFPFLRRTLAADDKTKESSGTVKGFGRTLR